MRVSHGCVRMFPENIELLYNEITVGEAVAIVDQPWLLAWHQNRLYLEAHQPLSDDPRDWPGRLPAMLDHSAEQAPYRVPGTADPQLLEEVTRQSLGIPLPVVESSPSTARYLEDVLEVNNVVELPAELRRVADDSE